MNKLNAEATFERAVRTAAYITSVDNSWEEFLAVAVGRLRSAIDTNNGKEIFLAACDFESAAFVFNYNKSHGKVTA